MSFGLEDDTTVRILILTETKKAVQELKELNASLKATKAAADQTKTSVAGAGAAAESSLNRVAPAARKAEAGLLSLNNIARTVFGTFTAMAVFFVTKFVGDAIAKTLSSLNQLELSFYKLGIAEKALSQSGVNITPKDLTDIADSVVATFKTVSQIDALKMISNLSVLTKDLNLTKEQYKQLALAIPLVARQADVSIDSATEQVINGLTKSGKGWADLGITVDANIIKQKAISLGLAENAEAYKNLTAVQQQQIETQALIAILYEKTTVALEDQDAYLSTIPGQVATLNKEWEEFTTELGKTSAPEVSVGLRILIKLVEALRTGVLVLRITWVGFVGGFVGSAVAIKQLIDGNIHSMEQFIEVLRTAGNLAAADALRMTGNPELPGDTPTGDPTLLDTSSIDGTADALAKAREEILEAELRLGQDLVDAKIDYLRKLDDIDTEYANKRADIINDTEKKVKDIQANARADQLKKEQQFQNRLLELHERFLMNLEEALHARDARQVLRLINQYNIDKNALIRKHALENQEDKKAAAQKIADAQKEQNDKLKQLNIAESRERQAALISYQRKQQDLRRAERDRLALMAAGLVSQFNLTRDGLNAILQLFIQYFGGGGYIDQVYAGMAQRLSSSIATGPIATTSTTSSGQKSSSAYRRAEGGTVIADRPTNVVFGEAGPEVATFTPIGRRGKDMNKVFSNLSPSSGESNGRLSIELTLSPDLESRIVESALNNTARIVTRVARSK